jgi:NhaP-type Na+/H+ or K+/H+ antiporter
MVLGALGGMAVGALVGYALGAIVDDIRKVPVR